MADRQVQGVEGMATLALVEWEMLAAQLPPLPEGVEVTLRPIVRGSVLTGVRGRVKIRVPDGEGGGGSEQP